VEPDIKVPINDFDGKVTYGEKRGNTGKQTSKTFPIPNFIPIFLMANFRPLASAYDNHVAQMAPTVRELAQLESHAQLMYLERHVKQR